jgi:pseudaminic acid synthase
MRNVVIVAELSANHGHDLDIALRSVRAAKNAGADAIKLQTYTPETMTLDCDSEYFRIKHGTIWDGTTLYRLYQEAYTPWEWHKRIKQEAEGVGLTFFSTPFDTTAVDFLDDLGVPIYKIASFEITDIPLIEYVAAKGKPIVISTGIATLSDIEEAVRACRRMHNSNITLLKCTSAYPAAPEDANLLTIPNLKETFRTSVGVSDHTPGLAVPVAAVALGAEMVEKHFILDRSLGGPDAAFSMEPEEFKAMSAAVRTAAAALGQVHYSLSEGTKEYRRFARSLFAVRDIPKGHLITGEDVRSIRPGYGLPPKYLPQVIGMKARIRIERGTPISWSLLDEKPPA